MQQMQPTRSDGALGVARHATEFESVYLAGSGVAHMVWDSARACVLVLVQHICCGPLRHRTERGVGLGGHDGAGG